MNEELKISQALSCGENGRVMTPYSFTIEEILEIEEYHKQGKVHPLDIKYPSSGELRERAGRNGKMAEKYLRENNFPKYMKLRSHQTLWFELANLSERIEKFKDEMMEAYEDPPTHDFFERVRAKRAYMSMIEERVFEEYIKPIAAN